MRFLSLLVPVLMLPVAAQDVGGFESRIQAAESVVARFYRGEGLEEARRRVNTQVDAFNGRVAQWNARLDQAKVEATADTGALSDLESQVAALDRQLARKAAADDPAALRRFNQRIEERNALVARYNLLVARARNTAEAYESLAQQSRVELQKERERLQGEQQALASRVMALDDFQRDGRDVAFVQGLNRLLADLRQRHRSKGGAGLQTQVERVRGLRRELARWAMAQQQAQDNGLVLVEAMVGDEPCCFIVDTGAQRVCLSMEIIVAAGFEGLLGKESVLVLAGGQRIRGRQLDFPAVTVNGSTEQSVAGSVVPVSEVGIDGLLGQSYLRRFVYTLDSGKAEPLTLLRR
ncbi:MAG: hypothetical protein H6Q00_2213 [Holophagaceae bacterium]|nr:hypothetical protein [Holophagaceae bacterium]